MSTTTTTAPTPVTDANGWVKKILVIQARWVLMGFTKQMPDGTYRVREGSVVRVWGTTYGLGQIAIEGPTASTVLDTFGDAEVPLVSVLFTITCFK